ncbi:MAG: hypothetical protein Q9220_000953 [cf. Caloplaca sp. 1 TL-2023]
MADGILGVRDAPDLSSKAAGVDAGPPRQDLPQIIAPGLMVASTQSGKAVIVTAAPSYYKGNPASLLTNPRTFTISLASTPTPSTIPTSTPTQTSLSSPSPTSAPSHGLSTAKLTAIIVVPLVVLLLLAPFLIIWDVRYKRKRRAAERHSERLSAQKPLIDRYQTASNHHHHNHRSSSNPPPGGRRPKRPHRIVSVPTPTFSSFNFGFSRPASAGPTARSPQQQSHRVPSKNRRSATFSWASPPPPYTSSTTPIPRIDTPDFPSSPFLETAQMVHIRPISGQRQQSYVSTNNRSNTRLPASSSSNLIRSSSNASLPQPPEHTYTLLQPPEHNYRRGSSDDDHEFLHARSTLQRPFSFQAPSTPSAFSDISGLSFDPTLWASSVYGERRNSGYDVSPVEDEEGVGTHQMV